MARYRKKPIEVEALHWAGGDTRPLDRFCGYNWGRHDAKSVEWTGDPADPEKVVIWDTMTDTWLALPVGFWLIRGVRGELYPCHDDVFSATYEAVG